MKIYADKLADALSRTLMPVYLVFGNEPLLILESRTAIEHKAREQGYDEKYRFTLDASLDWNEVLDCCQSMSLFSSRQLIELEIPEAGINAAAGKELVNLSQHLNPDILLLLVGSKLTKAQENATWFKNLMVNGCVVNCLTPDITRLPQFVAARCRALGLSPDAEAIQMLAQWHEGNLFALAQSLEKLALLYPDGQLTLVRLEESLSRHNHFTPFHWVDALLEGKPNRAQRILRQLAAEDVEPIILMRTMQKELIQLMQMRLAMSHQPMSAIFDKYRVWQNKRPHYSAALQRLSVQRLQHLLQLLAQCEIVAKTQYEQSPWPILHQLSLECCVAQANLPLPA